MPGAVMFYCLIDSTQFKQYGPDGLELIPKNGREISKLSSLITTAAIEQLPVAHPDYPGAGITLSVMHQPPVTQERICVPLKWSMVLIVY